jgi:hypothetical protein
MQNKPHLKLDTKRQSGKPERLKLNYGFGPKKDDLERKRNYYLMARNFKQYLSSFYSDQNKRIGERDKSISVAAHIEYIRILFQSQFDLITYFQPWYNEFGLLGINFSKFNNEILFAIVEPSLFGEFINNIQKFIQNEFDGNKTIEYSGKIKYIKEFKLLSTREIIQYNQPSQLMNVLLTHYPLNEETEKQIRISLIDHLEKKGITYKLIKDAFHLELYNATNEQIVEIAQNFDIILSITSSLATVIRPTEYNLPERSYGFEIENTDEDLPIIGIIDTGICIDTPLAPLIVNDDTLNITGSSSFLDNATFGSGHGTGVAALAALGRNAYFNGYKGKLKADAKLLSIKILDNNSGTPSEYGVLDLLRKAKSRYPNLKIFVLTVCYDVYKSNNDDYSTYAYELDKFSHENDCLIIICTANNDKAADVNNSYNLDYFFLEETNICSPAESMNSIVVGAAANSLRNGNFEGISTSKEFPTLFSRRSHIDLQALFSKNKINNNFFRPDVIECGGDYEQGVMFIGAGSKATMEILSAKSSESFYKQAGTSFSAPLVANIAARIQKTYPSISTQSIKALIVNGASLNLIRFPKQFTSLLNKTAGHGFVEPEKCINSNENSITFIIEEEIPPEEVKIFPLNFPEYLTKTDLGKVNGILKITTTLCFSFHPVLNHQLAYCPVHISFGFFKNQSAAEILATEETIKSKIKAGLGWSESCREVSRPSPYMNTQKTIFVVNKKELLDATNTFKLAVRCRLNPQLLPGTESRYKTSHPFSIAITIEENLLDKHLTGNLYSEMESVNYVENIAAVELGGEAILEAEN